MPTAGSRPRRAARLIAAALGGLLAFSPAVAADRPLPASVTVLTRDDFANRHWFSVADVLDHAPSVNVARTGYRGAVATARARGASNPNALMIAIDGRPVSHLFDGAVDLSQIPLNLIERIEITRGGANVMYGPAVAGVVNIVTSRPVRKGVTVDLGTGVGRNGVRETNGRLSLRNWAGDLFYAGGLEDVGGFTENSESELTTHFGNFTRSFRAGGYWGVEMLHTEGRVGTPGGTPAPFDQWNGHEEKIALDRTAFRDRIFQQFRLLGASPEVAGGVFHLEVTESARDEDTGTAAGVVDQDNHASDARLRFSRKGLDVGGEFAHVLRHVDGAIRRRADRSAAFATQRIEAGRFTFQPGVRWDRHSDGGDAPTLRGAALFQPAAAWTASLTAQRAPRFATLSELSAAGPSALRPEKSDSLDAGIVWEPGPFRAAVTYFTSATRDVIAAGAGGLVNGARERADGVEAEASGRVGNGAWSEAYLKASWTRQDAERRDVGAATYGDAPLAPREMGFVSIDYILPRNMTLTNEARYESAQHTGTGRTGTRLPPYVIWNARIGIRIHSAIVHIGCDNILGRRYAEATGLGGVLAPQPGRTFWTGVNVRFLD